MGWAAAIVLFGLAPALSFAGMCDASLSFQLYARKHRHVRIQFRPDQRAAMPPAALGAERAPGRVDLVRWALGEMNVAAVMETRVATRIGRELARRAPDAEVRVEIAGPPGLVR